MLVIWRPLTVALRQILRKFGLAVVREKDFKWLTKRPRLILSEADLSFILSHSDVLTPASLAEILPYSTAQLRQDVFALGAVGSRRNGYFVEFGATDGISLSNTFMLETMFGWSGVLAEPGRGWHSSLRKNRNCSIDTRCV